MDKASVAIRPSGRIAEHRVEIDAPAEVAWRTLADLSGWAAWNPLYPKASGVLAEGERIDATIVLSGLKPQHISATIRLVRAPEALEYTVINMGGMVRVWRYIEIRALSAGRCEVINGEIMGGPIGKLLARVVGGKVRQGLEDMNKGLKRHLEATQVAVATVG